MNNNFVVYNLCSLQKAKGLLAMKAEELARLRQENIDMEDRMAELAETHE